MFPFFSLLSLAEGFGECFGGPERAIKVKRSKGGSQRELGQKVASAVLERSGPGLKG